MKTNKKIITVFKTYTFKLHTPTEHKKAKILKTMIQGKYAFYHGLKHVKAMADQLIGKSKAEKLEGLKGVIKKLQKLNLSYPFGSALKASNIKDVAGQVSSYIELSTDDNAGYPERIAADYDYETAINSLLSSTTIEQEDEARDEMSKIYKSKYRPLSYYKSRQNDGFMILSDDKKRLFAFISLWGDKDKRASKITVKNMTVIRTGEKISFTSKLGLLIPLECSNFEYNAIKQGQSKSAKLYYRNNAFYLAVSVEFKTEAREPELILGIDRGIAEVASYAIRKKTGEVVKTGSFSGEILKAHQKNLENKQKLSQEKGRALVKGSSGYSNHLMHHISKYIAELADKYNAQVVIEDLKGIKNGPHHRRQKFARRTNYNRLLSRQQYGKLEFMLNYKLQSLGLPKARKIFAAYTSLTCPACGHVSKDNRPERAVFLCCECKYKKHSDINAAINIAGKYIWLKNGYKKDKFNIWQANNIKL